jgi:hypothetical protein
MVAFTSMDAFVHQLLARLLEPDAPLTRNRHFHTLDNPEGRHALRLARRLRALAKELVRAGAEGTRASVRVLADGETRELKWESPTLKAQRWVVLGEEEFALLAQMPGVTAALLQE